MIRSENNRAFGRILGLAIAAVLLSALLMAVRGYSAISLTEPLQAATRGCEYESSYALWKYATGQPVFVDPTHIPFAGSYYNWLYYVSYGEIIRFFLNALSLSDAWIPTIAKLITLAGALTGALVTAAIFTRHIAKNDPWLRGLGAALAGYLFFGPLIGFWGISNAPDIWALVLDIAAIALFLELYDSRPRAAVLVFCGFAYLAWSFKQIQVYGPGTVGLYLLWRRDWRGLALLVFGMGVLWAGTLLAGGSLYQKVILSFGGTKVKLQAYEFFRNLGIFISKEMPLLAGLALVPALWANRTRIPREDSVLVFALMGTALSFALTLPASAKQGAGDNYYFVPSFFLSLALLAALAWLKRENAVPRYAVICLAGGWLFSVLVLLSVFAGMNGVLSVRKYHGDLMTMNQAIGELPQPSFIANPYLELPWMRPKTQHFVLQCSYFWDRTAGIPMEKGGLGGLISEGYFASLVLPAGGKTFDGAGLDGYRAVDRGPNGSTIYLRKSP